MSLSNQVRWSASQERLEDLIEARLQPGADKQDIDERIWDLFGEDWAILFTDLSGFSRRVKEFGIIHFLQIIYESEKLMVPLIHFYNGILLKSEGDSMLVIFKQPNKALQCALAMQRKLFEHNQGRSPEDQILLCLGLGYGRILKIGDTDVFGAEVNAASRLGEDMARAWEILVTDALKQAVAPNAELSNLSYTLLTEAPPGADQAFKVEFELTL